MVKWPYRPHFVHVAWQWYRWPPQDDTLKASWPCLWSPLGPIVGEFVGFPDLWTWANSTKNRKFLTENPQKHPGGPKTVLMKTQFLKKTCVSPQRGNNLYPWKSVKFGRPNLSLFLGNCVFTSVKHHFVIHFDRASITLLSFHFICRNISTVFSSSFLYLFTKRHCHILAYNITSLCLAPKEFGMIFCSWSMQHQ